MKNFRESKEIMLGKKVRSGRCLCKLPFLMFIRVVMICASLILLFAHQPAVAQTFNDALNTQLDGVRYIVSFVPCVRLVGGDPTARDGNGVPLGFGPQLADICATIDPSGSGGSYDGSAQASSGGGVTSTSPAVERRLQKLREEEKNADGDLEITLGPGLSAFFSTEFENLDQKQTAFEDRYDSNLWGATLGADYLVNDSMVAGLALNFNRWDGNYGTGGGFENDSLGVIGFASFLPREHLFIDVILGYARKDISQNKRRFYSRDITFTDPGVSTITTTQVFGGRTDAERTDNEISALLRMGYDYSIHRVTFGPRLAMNWLYSDIDGYTEKGNTGLELQYQSDSRILFQTRLGLQASMAISTRIGVITPQIVGNWVHEFADDQRAISAQFVQDLRTNPTIFSFHTNDPDRNFLEFGAGVAVAMPRGIQAFANVRTIQEHQFLDSTAVSAGLRVEF